MIDAGDGPGSKLTADIWAIYRNALVERVDKRPMLVLAVLVGSRSIAPGLDVMCAAVRPHAPRRGFHH